MLKGTTRNTLLAKMLEVLWKDGAVEAILTSTKSLNNVWISREALIQK